MSTDKIKITVLGSVNLDMVVKVVRLPREGESVEGLSVENIPGGKGANQAVQSSLLDAKTWFIGCVGTDESGATLVSALREKGVRTDFVSKMSGTQSGTCAILVDPQGRNMLAYTAGANRKVETALIEKASEAITESDFLIAQNEINPDATMAGLKYAHEYGIRTILNPAPAFPLDDAIFPLIDFITPNETECETYTGILRTSDTSNTWERESAEWFLGKGVGAVCITLGGRGAYFFDGKTELFSPAFPVEAVDTTAAGDCFNAGFAVGLAKGMTLPDSLRFANACGALAASRMGAQTSIGTIEEIQEFLQKENE